jgi:hypothetical protein
MKCTPKKKINKIIFTINFHLNKNSMKRVPMLMLLIMAFVSFATMDSFADSSPPGVEIGINYELPEGANLNVEIQVAQVWQTIELNNDEGRIAVYDCDLKIWPGVGEAINYNSNNIAMVNSVYDDALNRATMFEKSLYTKNSIQIKDSDSNQYRLAANENEVLSLFYNSKGERFSARNEVT